VVDDDFTEVEELVEVLVLDNDFTDEEELVEVWLLDDFIEEELDVELVEVLEASVLENDLTEEVEVGLEDDVRLIRGRCIDKGKVDYPPRSTLFDF
jgi:hypothetical protein